MTRLVTALSCLALGAGVAGCAGAGATPVSQRPVAQRPGPAGAQTITQASAKNIQLVTETQNVLDELHSATHDLATHAIPTSETLTELQDLSDRATAIGTAAAIQLPASDPARPLIVRSDRYVATTASTLRTVQLGAATSGQLIAVAGPLTKLTSDIGEVARHVTPLEASNISQDLTHLHQTLGALPTSSSV